MNRRRFIQSFGAASAALATGAGAAAPSPGIAWGFLTNYQFGYKGAPVDFSNIGKLIEQLGRKPAYIHSFFSWKKFDGSYRPFPAEFADYARVKGAMPLITWPPGQADVNNQVEDFHHNRPQPDFDTVAIASGEHDAYVREWAAAAKAYKNVVYVRFMHEVLGTPYPHAYGQNRNNDPAQYVAAYRRVIGIFQKSDVTNVRFVWCFGCGPRNPPFENFFPGDDVVDWVSLDGYNTLGQGRWRTFEDVFGREYSVITKISRRPVMVAEIGCVEDPDNPGAKPAWIKDALLNFIPAKMPRIKAVIFFNSGGHTNRNYQIDSSPASLAAYQSVIASPLYQASAPLETLSYEEPDSSLLTVNSGQGSGDYSPRAKVTIKAAKPSNGQAFDHWAINRGDPKIANAREEQTELAMPPKRGLVLVTAIYKPAAGAFRLIVLHGCTGDGFYATGSPIHIAADKAPAGKLFDKWIVVSGDPKIGDESADSTTLTMPPHEVSVTASYRDAQ